MFTDELYEECANLLGVEMAAFKAVALTVAEIESGNCAFTKGGRVMSRFEGHVFYDKTDGKYAKTNPKLCYPEWNDVTRKYSFPNADDDYVQRFSKAFLLNPDAAIQATSWGVFQIMGFHFKMLGFETPGQMLNFLKDSTDNHLRLFAKFLNHKEKRNLKNAMLKKNWATFAYFYNGKGYKKNKYDTKLSAAYEKYV
jgi:hypothetical protein